MANSINLFVKCHYWKIITFGVVTVITVYFASGCVTPPYHWLFAYNSMSSQVCLLHIKYSMHYMHTVLYTDQSNVSHASLAIHNPSVINHIQHVSSSKPGSLDTVFSVCLSGFNYFQTHDFCLSCWPCAKSVTTGRCEFHINIAYVMFCCSE